MELVNRLSPGSVSFFGLGEMLVFMAILVVGLAYVWKKGALHGTRTQPETRTVSYEPQSQEGWVTTRLDFLVNWGRANSLWPMPFGTACCAIEFMATAASRFDLARFGMERLSYSPRQADVLICAGRVPYKLAPIIRRIWQQMPQPKWSISMGLRIHRRHVRQLRGGAGHRHNYPVDVYVPGCPPRPEGLLYGIRMLQEKVMASGVPTIASGRK